MISGLQWGVVLALHLGGFLLAGWALVDAASRQAVAFQRAGKRTKGLWLGVTGVATALAFVAIPMPIGLGIGGPVSLLLILAVVGAGVYLADVRPAVREYGARPRRGSRGTGQGGW